MGKIKVSVIGTRTAGRRFHIPGLSSFPDVDLSICDINKQLLSSVGEEFHIRAEKRYVDYQEMLKKENPQAVYVLMAQYPHKERMPYCKPHDPSIYFKIANEVIDQKRDILVEKPLAMTPEEALPLAEKAEKAGIISMVSMNRRFNPLVVLCKKIVEQNGPIVNVNCNFYKGLPPSQNDTSDWLTADMIHALDLMRFLMQGEITDFFSSIAKIEEDTQPTAFHALARFKNGGTGIFSSNVRVGARIELWQIHGVGISALIQTDASYPISANVSATIFRPGEKPVLYRDFEVAPVDGEKFHVRRGFQDADRYFVNCVSERKQPHCNFADAYKTVLYCHQILQGSVKTVKNPF